MFHTHLSAVQTAQLTGLLRRYPDKQLAVEMYAAASDDGSRRQALAALSEPAWVNAMQQPEQNVWRDLLSKLGGEV